MLSHLRNAILLILAILLAACGQGQVSTPVQFAATVAPAQQQTSPITAEKRVTLVPASEMTVYPKATTAPTLPAVDEKARDTVAANLRALTGEQKLELSFKALDRSPNASNFSAIWFVDQQDNSYYVRPDTLQPIEFTIERPIIDKQGSAKTADELRAAAEQFAKAQSTHFEKVRDRLTYTEGIKGENNFFRWEMPGTNVGNMPAIFQVGLKQDGILFSYLNSLDFLP